MMNYIHISINSFLTIYVAEIMIGSVIYYLIPLIILFIAAVIYYISGKNKKNYSYKYDVLIKRISLLKEQNETLSKELQASKKELAALQSELKEFENERNKWLEEKKKLEYDNKNLQDRIQHSKKEEDIIIEFYTKEKSND